MRESLALRTERCVIMKAKECRRDDAQKGENKGMNQHNPVSQELLEKAEKQRQAYFLEENTTVSVPMRRDLYETARRFFGARGMSPAEAMTEFIERTLKDGALPWENEGGKSHGE